MNKRQARKAALTIAFYCIRKEIGAPTDLTYSECSEKDEEKVREQLHIIAEQILRKISKED